MYQQPKIEGKINLRVAIISVLVATVILGLVVAIIVIANTKPNIDESSDNTTTVIDKGADESDKASTVTGKAEGVANEAKSTNSDSPYADSSKKTEKKTEKTTTTVKNLPKTGPEELFPLMILGGALAAYGVSALKTRRK